MHEDERRARGMKKRRQILGDAHVDRAQAQTTPLTEDFQDLITRYVWGEIWTRPRLDGRTRRLLVIGTLLALGRWEEFSLHVRSAIEQRALTVDEVKEVVLQQAVYCGVPAANHALSVVRSVVSTASATSLLGPARSRSRSSGTRRDRGRSRT